MAKKKIPEIRYRASRICRVLGNPTAYETMNILKKGKKTPHELAHILGVSLPTISHVFRSLRQLDLVRYDVKFRERIYWIKEETIVAVMQILENMVKKIKTKEY
ncbi:MAG: winged helix-turn-helix transcriptional regulator [candidate division WOR-3 bacterium]|nr:MAG: winged helix-turn-helix transcriptional regulator [candidate division WOR-3 bacterium]